MAKEAKSTKKSPAKEFVRGEQMGARRTIIEEMFNDLYNDRRNIYLMNFIRGIFFGIGSALGGTIIIGLIIWLLSIFVGLPGIGPVFEGAQESLQTTEKK